MPTCELHDTADHLSGETRVVESSFTRHDHVALDRRFVETAFFRDEREARNQLCSDRVQTAGESAGGTATDHLRDVDVETLSKMLGSTRQTRRQKLHLRCGGTLLRSKHISRIEKERVHIARDDEFNSLQSRRSAYRLHRAETSVSRGRTSDTHDDALGAEVERGVDQLPCTDGGCSERVVVFGTSD